MSISILHNNTLQKQFGDLAESLVITVHRYGYLFSCRNKSWNYVVCKDWAIWGLLSQGQNWKQKKSAFCEGISHPCRQRRSQQFDFCFISKIFHFKCLAPGKFNLQVVPSNLQNPARPIFSKTDLGVLLRFIYFHEMVFIAILPAFLQTLNMIKRYFPENVLFLF